jgi:hypothetical protein
VSSQYWTQISEYKKRLQWHKVKRWTRQAKVKIVSVAIDTENNLQNKMLQHISIIEPVLHIFLFNVM